MAQIQAVKLIKDSGYVISRTCQELNINATALCC